MDTLSYKTISGNAATADKKWFVVDAENQTVGRLASKVAKVIRGKHKTNYTPHADCGDNIIVINAEKVSKNHRDKKASAYDCQFQANSFQSFFTLSPK